MTKSRKSLKSKLLAGGLVAGVAAIGTLHAGAAPITVVNPSFEIDSPGLYLTGPTGWSGSASGVTANGGVGNYMLSTTAGTQYLEGNTNYAPFTWSVSQTTGYTASLGDTFTLTVGLGELSGQTQTSSNFAGRVALLIDGTIVAENTAADSDTPVPGGFADATITYTATSNDAGGPVGIELLLNTPLSGADFDNVRLNVDPAATPEPSTWAMMLAGLVSLIGLGRLRRKV
jgi:hypothetical protein